MKKKKAIFQIDEKFIESVCNYNDINFNRIDLQQTIRNLQESGFEFVEDCIVVK